MRPHTDAPWWTRGTAEPLLPPSTVRGPGLRTRVLQGAAAATLTLALATVLHGSSTPDTYAAEGGNTAHRQTLQALIGSCGPIYTNPGIAAENGPIPVTRPDGTANRATYRTIVPFHGPYYRQSAAPTTRFYPRTAKNVPAPEALLGWQARGVLVAFYATEAHPDDVTALAALSTDPTLDMVVVPWESTRRGALPYNRKIAYATWGATQTCQRMAANALHQFRATHPASTAPSATP